MTSTERRLLANEFDRLANIALETAMRQKSIKEARFYEGQRAGLDRAAALVRMLEVQS